MRDSHRLLITWIVLIGLTVGTGLAGRVTAGAGLGLVFLAGLGLVSLTKARLILAQYLDLRRAPAWNQAFNAILLLLVLIVYGLSAIPIFGP